MVHLGALIWPKLAIFWPSYSIFCFRIIVGGFKINIRWWSFENWNVSCRRPRWCTFRKYLDVIDLNILNWTKKPIWWFVHMHGIAARTLCFMAIEVDWHRGRRSSYLLDDKTVHCSRDLDICDFNGKLLLSLSPTSNQPKGVNVGPLCPFGLSIRSKNIAKVTTDPRVEFCLPK